VRGRAALGVGVLALAALLAAGGPTAAGPRLRVTWHPAQPRVGDAAWVLVQGVAATATLEGSVGGRPLTFFPYADGQAALTGFDLDVRPGTQAWRVAVLTPGQEPETVRGRVVVRPRAFRVQRLTLPRGMVDLDPETERRAVREGEHLQTLARMITPERLWHGAFTRPVAGREPGSGFGARRVINGEPKMPHGGTDFPAPAGMPVVAANAGRVALVADYFFPGRLVAIDHGLGLHTLYFHLQTVSVAEGDRVERGQPIGTVGATGRATGPHLHFAVQIGSARVDPATLLGLRFRD